MAPLVRPTLVLLALGALATGLVGAISACSSDVTPAPADPEPRLCDPGKAIVPCDAGAPGALESCTADPKDTTYGRLLPQDKSYPVGCRSYFPAQDCTPLVNCYCREDDGDAGTARWKCEK